MASSTGPETWSTFDVAVKAAPNYSGIGFCFSKDDPYVGIDLDHCIAGGTIDAWAQEIVERFDSYAERSVSGSGVHIIVRNCRKPGDKCKKKGFGGKPGADVEIYEQGRYFCFTASLLPGKPTEVNSCQSSMDWLYDKLFPSSSTAEHPSARETAPVMEASDSDLIEIATKSKQGERFSALWAGDLSLYGGDHSSADLGLCSMLAFYTSRDPERIDRMFRQSGLMRPKWEKREDYRSWTIEKAVAGCTEVYTPKGPSPSSTPGTLYRLPEVRSAIRAGHTIYLTGSRGDADALIRLGLCGSSCPAARSASEIQNGYGKSLQGAKVVVLARNNQASRNHALQIAQALQGIAAETKVLDLPGMAKDAGISEWLTKGGTKDQLKDLAVKAKPYLNQTSVRPRSYELPEINALEQDMRVISGQCWDAIKLANDPPRYFLHAGFPSRLESQPGGSLRLRELTPMKMLFELTAGGDDCRGAADFVSVKKSRSGDSYTIPAKLGLDVVNFMLADPKLPLPVLVRITEVPVFAPDGSLSIEPGYHEIGFTYHIPCDDVKVTKVPRKPTPDEVKQARELIEELFVDFPFVDKADKAHAVAMLMLPFIRDLIPGPTPNHLVEAPSPGSGKGLLTDVALWPATGEPTGHSTVGFLTEARDGDEWRKQITTTLRNLPVAVKIDNITRTLDSGHLAAVLTTTMWKDRLLGRNEEIEVPVRCVWVTTANNPTMTTEIARRCVRIRLDPKIDRPWMREGFKHSDLKAWAADHRSELIRSALILGQNWLALGRPKPSCKPLGSYEQWSNVVGGILEAAGIPGFLANLAEFYEATDVEGGRWRSFVETWYEQFGSDDVGTADLFPLVQEMDAFNLGKGSERSQKCSFGRQLAKQRDRVIGEYRIVSRGSAKRAGQWGLEPTTNLFGTEKAVNIVNMGEYSHTPITQTTFPENASIENECENIHPYSPYSPTGIEEGEL
jgi:hypothetical protein